MGVINLLPTHKYQYMNIFIEYITYSVSTYLFILPILRPKQIAVFVSVASNPNNKKFTKYWHYIDMLGYSDKYPKHQWHQDVKWILQASAVKDFFERAFIYGDKITFMTKTG